MKIILIALLLATLFTPSFTKSDEEKATCLASMISAAFTSSTDTTCTACINLCMIGTIESNTFEGYKQACVDLCTCSGTSASYKTAAQTDACKSSLKLIIQIAGVLMVMLVALLI